MAGFQRLNALMAQSPQPQAWHERIAPNMLWDESRIRTFTPSDIEERLRLMRDYPMEMTEDGETYALVPSSPDLSRWQTEVFPVDQWNTQVRRGR